MISGTITGGLVALLTWLGVEPGLYIAPLYLVVKVGVVAAGMGVVWWRVKARGGGKTPGASPPPVAPP
jgi:hypothetical protein